MKFLIILGDGMADWVEEPGGAMGLQRVEHDNTDLSNQFPTTLHRASS